MGTYGNRVGVMSVPLYTNEPDPVERLRLTHEALRAVKDGEELAAIRAAAEISDRVYERIADERFTGRTERDLSHRIEQLFWEHGAEQLAFPVIVASGPNAAQPHAHLSTQPTRESH